MKKIVKIVKMEGMFGRDESADFAQFGLSIGDEIEVSPFVTNAVVYQPTPNGDCLFIYTWNIEKISEPEGQMRSDDKGDYS